MAQSLILKGAELQRRLDSQPQFMSVHGQGLIGKESELERWVEVIEQEVQIPEPVRGGSVSADRLDGEESASQVTFSRNTSS